MFSSNTLKDVFKGPFPPTNGAPGEGGNDVSYTPTEDVVGANNGGGMKSENVNMHHSDPNYYYQNSNLDVGHQLQ
jgi:hypothetical protein